VNATALAAQRGHYARRGPIVALDFAPRGDGVETVESIRFDAIP
jgi:hypothetical protein